MIAVFSSGAAFLNAVEGRWRNPVTQTRFYFTITSGQEGAGNIFIQSAGNAYTTTLLFTTQLRNGQMLMLTSGSAYGVFIIGGKVKSPAICLSPGNVLQLLKTN